MVQMICTEGSKKSKKKWKERAERIKDLASG